MEQVLQHWEFFAFLATWTVGSIAAAVSLRHKVLENEKATERAFNEIAKLQGKVETMDSDTVKELGRVREALARIEGMLQARGET